MTEAQFVQSVSDVERATSPLKETSPKLAIESLIQSNVEACSEYHGKIIASAYHPFVAAVHEAFSGHRPLTLSPDMFWLLICQGLARHVNANPEDMRRKFVNFDGKKTLGVRRDDFVKGSPENQWSDVFHQFSSQIKQHIGEENHSNIIVSFSTTGPIEKAANEIVLMESMKNYFEYELCTFCGIPEVSLEGTVQDWQQLCGRTEVLGNAYDLAWWTNRIVPILERIARNAAGADDADLWNNIYKEDGGHGSGGPYITGWVYDLFPYVEVEDYEIPGKKTDIRRSLRDDRGISSVDLPGSLCKTPFIWKYLDSKYKMEFLAGFIGFTQDSDTLAVRPKIGWAVREV